MAARVNPGEVSVGTSANSAATNIRTAINADIPSQVTAGGNGSSVVVTAVVCSSAGNLIPFSNISSANLTFNGSGTLGGTRLGDDVGSLRVWQGNNSGGLSRCIFNCTAPGATWTSSRGSWTGDLQSFILPINMFHGGIPGGDDCSPAGPTSGCGHLIAGTTRVWETIRGAEATVPTSAWYVTNNPTTQNMTKGTLGNRSFINQLKYSPKYQSVAIVGTNDANVWIGFNLGTGTASQANWVDVTGSNIVLPLRPVLGVAMDPRVPAVDVPVGYAAVGGFNANTPTQPGHIFQVSMRLQLHLVHLGRQDRQPAGHPGGLSHRGPEHPAAGLCGHRLRSLLHQRRHCCVSDLEPFRQRNPACDDLGHVHRSRRDDALSLDTWPRRIRLSFVGDKLCHWRS